MSVLRIRAHKRFGVYRRIQVFNAVGDAVGGLLIELSLEGCRISDVETTKLSPDENLTVIVDDEVHFDGLVRWRGDRIVGLRLQKPFHIVELEQLIRSCRDETPALKASLG